jgi:photosystem II stability/assembly factor-like uncharacterized protein
MKQLFNFLLLLIATSVCAQRSNIPQIEILTKGTNTSIRGLSVVNDNIVWVSGHNGTIGRSSNGGKDWKWMKVKGFEKRDFRDIEAFDATTAIIMAVDTPAYILKTTDGGESWKVVYENKTPGMFLDAMEFWNEQAGIVIGDPIGGKFFIARTFDGGNTWKEIPEDKRPKAETGEACFAASGTNVRRLDTDEAVFVSGGTKSRVFIRNQVIDLPIIQGKESTGANSIAVYDNFKHNGGQQMIVVGGDFSADSSSKQNCYFSNNRGKTWRAAKTPPTGYRSCVEYLSKKRLITCGLNGVDYSYDGGNTWKRISDEGFHVTRIAKLGQTVYLAGGNGKIGKLILPD